MRLAKNLRTSWALRTSIVPQLSALDCGAAALGSILKYHAISASYLEVLEKAGTSRDGTSTTGLIRAARAFGLGARIRNCTASEALSGPVPSIVFWDGYHFVVLEGAAEGQVTINDPQSGRRAISQKQFHDRYAGRLIEFDRPKQRRSGTRMSAKFQGQTIRSALCLLAVLTTALALAWITLPEPEHSALSFIRNGVLVMFLAGMALAAIGILFPAKIPNAHPCTKQIPRQIRQIWPPPLFSTHRPGHGFDTPMVWITCLIVLPVGLSAMAQGAGFAILWVLLPLVMLMSALFGLFLRQKWLAQNAIASTGAQRLRAQFTELCMYPDQLRLLLRDTAFTSTFIDWQRRRFRETRSVTRYDLLKAGCAGMAGMAVVLITVFLQTGATAWLILIGFILTSISVFMFAGRSERIDPTRQNAVAKAINSDTRTRKTRQIPPGGEAAFSELRVRDITFGFDPDAAPILLKLSLTLTKGDIVAVTGPSACGKTTLGRLVAGLDTANDGSVQFDPPDTDTNRICFLSETPALTTAKTEIPEDLVADLGLTQLTSPGRTHHCSLSGPMAELSQGQRQRLSIALCLASAPGLIVLDDALSCLDDEDIARIFRTLRSREITCLFLSNRWREMRRCDRIERLEHKRLTSLGSPQGFETYQDLLAQNTGAS